MKKLALLILLMLSLVACGQEEQQQQRDRVPIEEVIGDVPEPQENSDPGVPEEPASAFETKTFSMIARNWEFEPSTITVQEGDQVEITIESKDVTHGFRIVEYGINERLEPNKPVTVKFAADKKGTFTFACSVPCGSGHRGMTGTLIVE